MITNKLIIINYEFSTVEPHEKRLKVVKNEHISEKWILQVCYE